MLASIQDKDTENIKLKEYLKTVENELGELLARQKDTNSSGLPQTVVEAAASNEEKVSLQDMIKGLKKSHQSEVDSLRSELAETVAQLQNTQSNLEKGEISNDEKGQQVAVLQNTVENLQAQLHAEVENMKEATVKYSSLLNELEAKDERINCMSIQISQQKELLAGLSQQLKDKDASIVQVMESASNERVKLGEENSSLLVQLETIEQSYKITTKKLEELEEHFTTSQNEIQTLNSEKLEFLKEKTDLQGEVAKVSKERDVIKKKLQAALVVRKDLLKRIDEYESQKEECVNSKTEVSQLQDKLQEFTNQAKATEKMFEENVSLLEKKLLDKESEILEYKTQRERLVEQITSEKEILQSALHEKEVNLCDVSQMVNEKDSFIKQLQSSAIEKEGAFERDRNHLMLKVEELQNEVKKCREELQGKSSSSASVVDLENELAQLKSEKATLQKKAQAALLARKETLKKAQESGKKLTQELAELKDDYKALLEQHCQQTNELNAIQLKADEKTRELEELHKTSLAYLDELETLRQLVEERDKTLHVLKMSLAEKESQCHSMSNLQAELETMKSRFETISFEMSSKDEALVVMKQTVEALTSKVNALQSDLEKAEAEIKLKTEKVKNYQEIIKDVEVKAQQENQVLLSKYVALENELNINSSALEEQKQTNKHDHDALLEEKEALLEQSNQLRVELNTAVTLLSEKSSEILTIQKTLTETQEQLSDEKDVLTKELDKLQLHYADTQKHFESLRQEKENAEKLIGELRQEVTTLSRQLKESEQQLEKTSSAGVMLESESRGEIWSSQNSAENFEEKLKEGETALSASQAQVQEKESLIAALELQLQQQIKMHEAVVDKMRIESEELKKSQEESTRVNDQDSQSKISLLTRKLQAALVSRKDLMKESATLKEEIEKLSSGNKAKEAEYLALEASVSKLKQENLNLESSISSVTQEKERISDEVDRVLNDNHSLSAACESLKSTIENITQQKQAFSCQLESLKDSQTEELSKWKSKHAELKQEYESLLQAYENVSSEMDKMRQLLEGAKRERQEALRKTHKHETEKEQLEKQVREMEEENEKMKERMLTFSQDEHQKIKELEVQNQNLKKELIELDVNHRNTMSELQNQKQLLEAEIYQLKESSDTLKVKLTDIEAENSQLAEKVQEASMSLEKKEFDSNTHTNTLQLKFDEALSLNNSLTAQIKAQKTELGAQLEISNLLQQEKQNLSERIEKIINDHEMQLAKKDEAIKGLKDVINRHSQETINLNEKVRILEDDKSLLQEELENAQEISDKVKNENEYLETVILKNSERIDELTESLNILQTQNSQLSTQLAASKEMSNQVRQEKEQEQLKLVRELEEKLKTVQRGSEGTKNVRKELQELLKEKHQEINQLQQNCIKYQELILDLESSLKSSQSACELLEKDLKKSSEKILTLEEKCKQVEDELLTNTNLLKDVKEKMESIKSERDQLALQVSQHARQTENLVVEKTNSLQTADESQANSYLENQFVLQQQLEDLKNLKDKESQKVDELRQQLDSQHLQIHTLKRAAETSEAKLSALSSTPQGSDASKLWNELYQKTLHEKDNQLLEQGFMIKRFLEDMRVKDKEVNEVRVTKSRLERTLNEYSVAAAAQQRQLFVMSASNAELTETAELRTVQLKELSAELERIEQDKNSLIRQLADKDDMISQMQLNLHQMEKTNADTDSQLQLLQSQNDKIRADFEKQEGIALQLKTLLQSKDAEISSLLSCKEGQMSGYLEQLQTNYRTQVSVYEDRLTSLRYQREKSEKELRGLEAKVKSLQIKVNRSVQEKEQMAAKMESFKNSMVSLQSERERLISQNRILEAKAQLGLKGKEGFADGEGGAAKGLKHEIRKLLHQMDDLNSENAMLRAQLVRYREDLNQVLSLKDNQLKVLLKKQQDVIKSLEMQKTVSEKQHRESRLEFQREEETSNALKAENSKLKSQVSKLEAEVLTQRKERAITNEGRVIVDLQDAVAAKAAECNDLQQKLLSQKISLDELKGKMEQLESETDKKLSEAEDRYNSELDGFEREVEVMRSERETADQRVADLARDLLEMEQQLSVAKLQSKDLKTQNESLCKAMAALQNDRDQLIEDFKILRNRYDEELRETQAALNKVERSLQDATSDLAMFAKERDILVHKLKALESKDPPIELNKLLGELSKALSEKERDLKKTMLENDSYSRQLSAFSRSMASLQNDRDRLMDEVLEAKRTAQTRQGASPESVTGASVEKLKSSSVNANQSETDGPMTKQTADELQQKHKEAREETVNLRSDADRKESPPVKQEAAQGALEEMVNRLNAERMQLHRDLQRCLYEIQQRDQYYQQLNTKLQQASEEKGAVTAQLRAVSQTLRDTQSRCHWLETQVQSQAQGSVLTEVAPGAPQERSSDSLITETTEAGQLRERLVEVELILAEERARREAAEEALRLAEDREKSAASGLSRDTQRDFAIEMEPEEEWEALSLDPTQPLITRKVKGGMLTCRRWLRGRSLYFSRLLTGRARSRYFFLAYLLTIHVLVLMCLTGAL
uniref:Golgin B1 n=1 Tax=Salarias fasciatus TaxID=181472 RepID=A0A672G496_SALFA